MSNSPIQIEVTNESFEDKQKRLLQYLSETELRSMYSLESIEYHTQFVRNATSNQELIDHFKDSDYFCPEIVIDPTWWPRQEEWNKLNS